MHWLIHERGPADRGEPYFFFAVHNKPATFPSPVFGLTALEDLRAQAPRKVVLHERQHPQPLRYGVTVSSGGKALPLGENPGSESQQHPGGAISTKDAPVVTDIELRVQQANRVQHEWRRLFVFDGRAYILIFAVEEAHVSEWSNTAQAVMDGISLQPEP